MSEIIERVARSIFASQDWPEFHPAYEHSSGIFEAAARAAIEAMRDPPSELYEALYEAMFIEKYDGTQAPMIGAGVDAFIDEALKETTP